MVWQLAHGPVTLAEAAGGSDRIRTRKKIEVAPNVSAFCRGVLMPDFARSLSMTIMLLLRRPADAALHGKADDVDDRS